MAVFSLEKMQKSLFSFLFFGSDPSEKAAVFALIFVLILHIIFRAAGRDFSSVPKLGTSYIFGYLWDILAEIGRILRQNPDLTTSSLLHKHICQFMGYPVAVFFILFHIRNKPF